MAKVSLGQVDQKLDDLIKIVDEVKTLVKEQNGRISALERWRTGVVSAGSAWGAAISLWLGLK